VPWSDCVDDGRGNTTGWRGAVAASETGGGGVVLWDASVLVRSREAEGGGGYTGTCTFGVLLLSVPAGALSLLEAETCRKEYREIESY
jgi:hypothetical protein